MSAIDGVERIKDRLAQLRRMYENYRAYQQDRVNEEDHHAVRDVACDLELTANEIAGLEFALRALSND
jgi:hypothetical protein